MERKEKSVRLQLPLLTAEAYVASAEDFAELREKRLAGGLKLVEVGAALGKSREWVRMLEYGRLVCSKETVRRVSKAVDDLIALRRVEKDAREQLFADAKLPRLIRRGN